MLETVKRGARALLRRAGFDLVRVAPPDPRYAQPSSDATRPLPAGAAEALRADHPRLLALRERYARASTALAARTFWSQGHLERELDLTRFRGDGAYVWQFRNVGASARDKYYFYLRELAARDAHGLLGRLHEDGLFGCWTFEYPGWPRVSRDLLDSVNELYFLDRQMGLLQAQDLHVLDVGAGYGRLAHRMLTAAPGVSRYCCADGVAESTFLCEYYLRFRGCGDRAQVVALDELDARLAGQRVDLAVNVHGFSEMSLAAVDAWLARIAACGAPWLFIVPNDAERMLTVEPDGTRLDYAPRIAAHGYALVAQEPVFADPTLREFMGVRDCFFLYRRVP